MKINEIKIKIPNNLFSLKKIYLYTCEIIESLEIDEKFVFFIFNQYDNSTIPGVNKVFNEP